MPSHAYPLLGAVAVQADILTESELDDVLRKASERGVPIGEMLFKLGYVSRDRLLHLLAEQYDTTVYDVSEWRPDDELLTALPGEIVRECGVLPVRVSDTGVVIATAGPFHRPLAETLSHIADFTGRRVDVVICEEEGLRRCLAEHFSAPTPTAAPPAAEGEAEWEAEDRGASGAAEFTILEAGSPAPTADAVDPSPAANSLTGGLAEFSSLVSEIRAEADAPPPSNAADRAELEDALDAILTSVLEVRSHPFAGGVAESVAAAEELLDKARQYLQMGMFGDGLRVADQVQAQLAAAQAKAEDLQEAWGPLLQHVEALRTRVGQLETEDAADFAPQEMGRLREIREATHNAIERKRVEELRRLVDEGQLLVEHVAVLSPRHNRRERLIENLTHVRDVLARARRLGAQTVAPAAVEAAYRLLDEADVRARDGAWDQVEDSLSQALAHASAAEEQALAYAEQRQADQATLVALCDTVETQVSELFAHTAVQTILAELNDARGQLTEARLAVDGEGELSPYTAALTALRDDLLPGLQREADAAQESWNAVGTALDGVLSVVRDGGGSALSPEAGQTAAAAAEAARELFEALTSRNLSGAQDVVQATEMRLRDFWEVCGRAREERTDLDQRLAQVRARLAQVDAQVGGEQTRDLVQRLMADLDRAAGVLHADALGDAAALLDATEQTIAEELDPAIAGWLAHRQSVWERVGALPEQVAELALAEGPAVAGEAYQTFVERAAAATRAAGEGDLDAAEAALYAADEAAHAIRSAADRAAGDRVALLRRRIGEAEQALEGAVEASAGEGAPELLEEAYYDLNAARSILEEADGRVTLVLAAQAEHALRGAELTARQVTALSELEQGRVAAALAELDGQVASAREDLERLGRERDWGLGPDALASVDDMLTDAARAREQGELSRGFEHVRSAERILDRVRAERQQASETRAEFDRFFTETLPEHLDSLDPELVREEAADAWEQLCAVPDAAAAARDADDVRTLADLHERAVELVNTCTTQERSARSRQLVRVHQARAEAHSSLRLATLLGAAVRSPDLCAAATQLVSAGDADVQRRQWAAAEEHYASATARAAQAQEAALQVARDAQAAQGDLVRTAVAHLAHEDVQAARAALAAAHAATVRAAPPAAMADASPPALPELPEVPDAVDTAPVPDDDEGFEE